MSSSQEDKLPAAEEEEDRLGWKEVTVPAEEEDKDRDKEESVDVEESKEPHPGPVLADDFVDEEEMKVAEEGLTPEQLAERFETAKKLKEEGNKEFQEGKCEESIKLYTKALLQCPLQEKEYRALLYANRSAAKIKYGPIARESALEDCTKSLENNDKYMKSLIRRAKLYEELDKLDDALGDYKRIFELDPSNHEARAALQRLPPIINERNEKLKEEMMGKLKDLGNLVLRPFGLSTSNFQLQPTEAGGYTINFKK